MTTMTTTATTHALDEPLYSFPPFPAPPEGVTIVCFSMFEPAGYRCITDASGDEIEVDAWAGVKTVKVLSEEEVKEKRKAKKKRRTAGNAVDAEGRLIPWWEEWEEGEALRGMSETSFNNHTNLEDRVCMAADDFRVGRTWPEIAHGVRLLWDQFRLYIGLISTIPVYKKIKNKGNGQVDGPENGGDVSDEEEDVPKARVIKIDVQDHLQQNALPGKQLEPNPEESTVEAQRLRTFLDDMEKTVKVFLSSYISITGLIWTDKNLFTAPTLLHFFLRFMFRNDVFADSKEHLDNLKRALSVTALAQKELPLTPKLGRNLPGSFDQACRGLWGTKGNLTVQILATSFANIDDSSTNGTICPGGSDPAFEAELRQQDIEIVSSSTVLDSSIAKQDLENNFISVPEATVEEYSTTSWTETPVPWLMQLLGPTTLPLTMRTGIVESSTRRIRDVIAPGVNSKGSATENGARTRDASTAEEVLDETFFKVVLSPWVGSASEETADFPRPMVASGSQGVVVAETMKEFSKTEEECPWNPYRDDLRVLVNSEVAGQLMVGMGLGGTWVQMVPEIGEKKHPRDTFWYIESLVATFPSYYTESEMAGGVPLLGEEEDD